MKKLKSFIIFTLTNFMYSFSQWIILIIILKLVGLESMGLYSVGLAISAPLVLLTTFGSNVLMITNKKYTFSNYFYTKVYVQSLIFIILCIFLIFFYSNNMKAMLLVSLVILLRFTNSFIDLYFASEIANKKHNLVALYKSILSVSYMLLNFFIIFTTESVILATGINIIANTVFLILITSKKLRTMKLSFKEIKALMILGTPLSFTLFLSSLNTNIPKYALEVFSSSYYVGIFTSILFFYSIGNQVFFSINSFVLPYIKEYKNDKKLMISIFKKLMLIPLLVFTPVLTIFIFSLDILIPVLFTEELLAYRKEIIIIITFSILIYYGILLDMIINLYEHYKVNTFIQAVSVIIVTLSSITINYYGLNGAILAFTLYSIIIFSSKTFFALSVIKRGL